MIAALLLAAALPLATVSGTVREIGSREPVPYAAVRILPQGRSVQADARGHFVIADASPGTTVLRVSAPGYRTIEHAVVVPEVGTLRVELLLPVHAVALPAIEARASAAAEFAEAGPAPLRLDATSIKNLPAVAEPDVLRAVQAMPSVAAASDFSSALYVRGGASDHTLVRLDGVPLFNPYHLGGAFGAVDPDAVASVELHPGTLPANLGGRLSGVLDIWTREGGRDRTRTRGSVGLISTRASVDGPLPGGSGSYAASARSTYLDLITGIAARAGAPGPIPYGFRDAHLKVTRPIGQEGKLSTSLYVNRERMTQKDEEHGGEPDRFRWGSSAGSLSFRQARGNMLGEILAGYSSFDASTALLEWEGASQVPAAQMDATMRDVLLALSLTRYGSSNETRLGGQVDWYQFSYEMERQSGRFFSDLFPNMFREDALSTVELYAEERWRPTTRLQLRGGVRLLHAAGRSSEVLPRVGIRLAASEWLALTAGAGRYAQAVRSLRNDESIRSSLLAYDLLAAVPRGQGLQTSEDLSVGLEWVGPVTRLRVDAYARRMSALVLPVLPADPYNAPVLVDEGTVQGTSSARGLEVSIAQEIRGVRLAGSYVWAMSDRSVASQSYAPRFGREHTVDVSAVRNLGSGGAASLRLVAASGQPYTPIVGVVQPFAFDPGRSALDNPLRPTFLLGEHNSMRLPSYLRVDVGWRKSYPYRGGHVTPFFQVINLLNTKNVVAAEPTFFGESGREIQYLPQLPLLPSFGVEWAF